jgi:Asp-tRNA(Asn)/Glu-tRNA(Gln) amidotransferase C subunit
MEVAETCQQIAELEVSELEHKQVKEKIKHINDILRAFCTANQLITSEKD